MTSEVEAYLRWRIGIMHPTSDLWTKAPHKNLQLMRAVWEQHWPRVESMYQNANLAVVIFTHIAIAEPAYRAVNIYEHGGYRDESGKLAHMLLGHTSDTNYLVGSVDPRDPCYGFERQDQSRDETSIRSGLRSLILEGRKGAADVFGTRREIEGISIGLDTAADTPKPKWHTLAVLISAGLRNCEGFRVLVDPKAADSSGVFLERFTFTTPTWNGTMFLPRDPAWIAEHSRYQQGVHRALATASAAARASPSPSTLQQREQSGEEAAPTEDGRGASRRDPIGLLLALLPLLVAALPWLERRLPVSPATVMFCSAFGALGWLMSADGPAQEILSTSASVELQQTNSKGLSAEMPSHSEHQKGTRDQIKKGGGGIGGLLGGCCWCRS